jgi:hypothetical protein
MRKTVRLLVWVLSITALAFAAACKPTIKATERPTTAPPSSSSAGEATQPSGGESQPSGETGTGGESNPAGTAPSGVPADVPVMDGAYSLQVMRGGDNIVYKVDTGIDDVVNFYKEQMPGAGWQETSSPDTVVASIASLVRRNDKGDQIFINLQANQLGGFVTVSISVTRAK